jgi:Rit1 N-terminal domain
VDDGIFLLHNITRQHTLNPLMGITGNGRLIHDVLIWSFYGQLWIIMGMTFKDCSKRRAILIDSTRRGKRMPDALSKTVPIWCAVINRCVSKGEEWNEVCFPEESVSAQEMSSIETLIPSFVSSFRNCGVDMPSISALLDKPLRPVFITPESNLNITISKDYYPVILLTASSLVSCGHNRIDGFVYIQGAADDEESWAHGLTSLLFWDNFGKILDCMEEGDLISTIGEIVATSIPLEMMEDLSQIGSTRISLGVGSIIPTHATIICGSEGDSMQEDENVLRLYIPRKSKTWNMTQTLFPATMSFAIKHGILNNSPILILASNLSRPFLDMSIATTLVLLCSFFDDKGMFLMLKLLM